MDSSQNATYDIGSVNDIFIGLKWDMLDKDNPVDLDASCVFFDMYGRIIDAVFFNQLNIGYAVHSGDNRTGEGEGYDETIQIKTDLLPLEVGSFMVVITCHSGGNFQNVETAEAKILNSKGDQLAEIMVGCTGAQRVLLFCLGYKEFNFFQQPQEQQQQQQQPNSDNNFIWKLKEINRTVNHGKHFKDVEKEMKEELRFLVPDEIQKEMEFDISFPQKTFNMSKGDVIRLKGLQKLIMGLGWDTKCDLDASIVEIKDNLQFGQTIYYGNLSNKNKSIRHSGDNLTGEGSGDDEAIRVNLSQIDKEVKYLVCVVNIYTPFKNFGDVKGAYCRLVLDSNIRKENSEHVICRYNLTNRKSGEAMIMCTIYRSNQDPNLWKVKAVGQEVKGRTASQSRKYFLPHLPGLEGRRSGKGTGSTSSEEEEKSERIKGPPSSGPSSGGSSASSGFFFGLCSGICE